MPGFARVCALAILLAVVTGSVARARPSTSPRVIARAHAATAPAPCHAPAPATAPAYAQLFAHVDPHEWGAADTAITVPVGHRSVWLFSDTFSSGPDGHGRFVHSTAITQDGGCLHVSHGGAQLLPDEHVSAEPSTSDPSVMYWIEGGRALGRDRVEISARAIELVGTGAWDFRDAGYTRRAELSFDAAGNLTFRRWTATTRAPAPDPGPLINCDAPAAPRPHHFCYARHSHPELRLATGHPLVTTSQNWDDGVLHRFADYRPLFSDR
jgi:hypothetical protein